VADVEATVAFSQATFPGSPIWIIGFGTGGAVGLMAASTSSGVNGVSVLATPADFDDWANRPDQLIVHSRKVNVIKDPTFPQDRKSWRNELQRMSTVHAARRFSEKPLLVLHGSEDELVPPLDARAVADAHGGADLRIINGAGHQLRHDPRALAMLLGWLDRHSQL
jgi:putative redox protein